jgi:hypothetical protein
MGACVRRSGEEKEQGGGQHAAKIPRQTEQGRKRAEHAGKRLQAKVDQEEPTSGGTNPMVQKGGTWKS